MWRHDPSLLPVPLLRALAAAPRHDWPLVLEWGIGARAHRLSADVRSWLAHDVLADVDAETAIVDAIRHPDIDELADVALAWQPAPWWFCLEALGARSTTLREWAALRLGSTRADLRLPHVDEAAARLVALLDSDARCAARALPAIAHRLAADPFRLRRLMERIAARFESPVSDAAVEIFAQTGDGRSQVQRCAIDVALAIVDRGSPKARAAALRALYRRPPSPGPDLDRIAGAALSVIDSSDATVRAPAIYALRTCTPWVEDAALFAEAVRAIRARLGDADADCRFHAAGAAGYVARKDIRWRLTDALLAELREGLDVSARSDASEKIRDEARGALKALDEYVSRRP